MGMSPSCWKEDEFPGFGLYDPIEVFEFSFATVPDIVEVPNRNVLAVGDTAGVGVVVPMVVVFARQVALDMEAFVPYLARQIRKLVMVMPHC